MVQVILTCIHSLCLQHVFLTTPDSNSIWVGDRPRNKLAFSCAAGLRRMTAAVCEVTTATSGNSCVVTVASIGDATSTTSASLVGNTSLRVVFSYMPTASLALTTPDIPCVCNYTSTTSYGRKCIVYSYINFNSVV